MNLEQWQRSKKIKAEAEAAAKRTVKRVLNAVKEPAMSEFKVGDKVVFQNSKSDDTEIYTVEAVLDGGRFLGINDYRQAFSSIKFRHAEPQEKAAGHRIESSNDQAISDCSVSNLCQNDT